MANTEVSTEFGPAANTWEGDYNNNGANIFSEIEPWHFGDLPAWAFYYTVGDEPLRCQYYNSSDAFVSQANAKTYGYSCNEGNTPCVKKNTFPNLSGTFSNASTTYGTHFLHKFESDVDLIVKQETDCTRLEDDDGKVVVKISGYTSIGYVMCGGGGSGGGWSFYDPSKNGSDSDGYIVAGGGGGGGGIVFGKINIGRLPNNSRITFTCGKGGDVVENRYCKYRHNGFVSGNQGNGGGASILKLTLGNQRVPATKPVEMPLSAWLALLAAAKAHSTVIAHGGNGGSGGTSSNNASGGEGGFGEWGTTDGLDKSYMTAGFVDGAQGCSASADGNTTQDLKWRLGIQIGAENAAGYHLYIDHNALTGKANSQNTSTSTTNNNNTSVPGGHSLGRGAERSKAPGYGGGGCCCESRDTVWWADTTHNVAAGPNNKGGDGVLILYY